MRGFSIWFPENSSKAQKIILIVEDIDRCTEEKIIQNIDALRVMLDDEEISKRLIILTAIDERILKSAIHSKYSSLYNDNLIIKNERFNPNRNIKLNELISEYLDKVFISAIKLGDLNISQKEEFLNELLRTHDDLNEAEIKFQNNEEIKSYSVITDFENRSNKNVQYDIAIKDGDIVFKEGDIALQDQSGNIVSGLEIEIGFLNKWEKLTLTEIKFLKEIIFNWNSATPRRINIFYYRYLLCKNLLISKYTALNKSHGWQDAISIKQLMSLLLDYSNEYDPEKITNEKNRVSTLTDLNILIPEGKTTKAFTKLKSDYLNLLEIFELVIAY